jgi:hypothetical protein
LADISQAGSLYPYREPPEDGDCDDAFLYVLQYAPTGATSGVSFGHSSMLSLSEVLTSDDLRVDSPIDTSMGVRTGSRGWVAGLPSPDDGTEDRSFEDPFDWDLQLFNISESHRKLVRHFLLWGSN